jgi:hypothetical protein
MLYREINVRCRCGGVVKNNVEVWVNEDEVLEVVGNCNQCSDKNTGYFPLQELIMLAPINPKGRRKRLLINQ